MYCIAAVEVLIIEHRFKIKVEVVAFNWDLKMVDHLNKFIIISKNFITKEPIKEIILLFFYKRFLIFYKIMRDFKIKDLQS